MPINNLRTRGRTLPHHSTRSFPGGGANPLNLSGLAGWWSADEGVYEGASFSRASVATTPINGNTQNAVDVATGIPRFVSGVNLINTKFSKGGDTLGVPAGGTASGFASRGTVSSVTVVTEDGANAIRVIMGATADTGGGDWGAANDDVMANRSEVEINTTYTAQALVKGTVGQNLTIRINYRNAAGTITIGSTNTVVATGAWQVITVSVGSAAAGITAAVVVGSSTNNATIYVKNIQLEKGATATTWRPGGPSAVLIEEGTTNLLTSAMSNGTADWVPIGGGVNTATNANAEQSWHGGTSVKVVTDGSVLNQGSRHNTLVTVLPSTSYTGSVWLRGTAGIVLQLLIQWSDATPVFLSEVAVLVTCTGGWQRVSVTGTSHASAVNARVVVRTNTAVATTFYVDGIQLEQKAYATSWQVGGTARAAEVNTVPAVVNFANPWTMEVVVTPTLLSTTTHQCAMLLGTSDGTKRMSLFIRRNSGSFRISLWTNIVGPSWYESDVTAVLGQTYTIAATYDGTDLRFYVDGVLKQTATVVLTGTSTGVAIGSSLLTGGEHLNGFVDSFAISNIKRETASLLSRVGYLTADANTLLQSDFRNDLAVAGTITQTTDTGPVGTVTDRSGNGRHLTQSGAGNKPAYRTNVLNGKPVFRFDGTSDYLQKVYDSAMSQPQTIFIVGSMTNNSSDYFYDSSSSTRLTFAPNLDGSSAGKFGMFAGGSILHEAAARTFPVATSIFSSLWNNGGTSFTRMNGTSIISGVTGTSAPLGITVGARYLFDSHLQGDIAEIIVYNRALTTDEIVSIERYLATKYNIALA